MLSRLNFRSKSCTQQMVFMSESYIKSFVLKVKNPILSSWYLGQNNILSRFCMFCFSESYT